MLKKIKENFDEYNLKARVYPTLLASIPVFLFLLFFVHDLTKINLVLNLISSSVLTILCLYFFSDVVRNLGKALEVKIFKNELYFPTTEFLLHANNSLSKEKRIQIHNKINKEYGCTLCSEKEEEMNEGAARVKIKEAVGLVRQKVGDGRLVLEFNIRYGFWRNLIGISLFSSVICIFCLFFFLVAGNNVAVSVFFILFVFYTLPFVFRKGLLKFFGYQYTEQLFLEYLDL